MAAAETSLLLQSGAFTSLGLETVEIGGGRWRSVEIDGGRRGGDRWR